MERRSGYDDKVCCKYHPDAPLIEDYTAGDMICPECGLVVGDRVIDVGSEWRTFENSGSDPSRVGGPENPLLEGGDLSTIIGHGTGSASFDSHGAPKYKSGSTMSSSNRSLISAFNEIAVMGNRINVPKSIVDRANNIFKKVREGQHLKGRSNDAKVAACIYIACREECVPRTFKEICAVSKTSKKEIGKCFKLILRALETNVGVINTSDFMSRFCAKLELPYIIQLAAIHIAKKANELNIASGKSPISIAAAAIYMASQTTKHKLNKENISDIAGVSVGTIKQSYQLMYPEAAKLFPEDFEFTTSIELLPQM